MKTSDWDDPSIRAIGRRYAAEAYDLASELNNYGADAAELLRPQHDPTRPRADLLQTQDAIVTHLANHLDFQLTQAEAARLKRTPAAAEDLALQCIAGFWKAGPIGKEAEAVFALCEQALAIDPNNAHALMGLGSKFFALAQTGVSGDPKGDLERADELVSKALALDPDWLGLTP